MEKDLENRANENKYLSVRPPSLVTYYPLADFYCSAHPLAPIAADVAPFSQIILHGFKDEYMMENGKAKGSVKDFFDLSIACINDCLMKPLAYITAIPLAKACIDSVLQFF